jgi:GNAT superfamily N-acetyltransferase
LSTKFGFPVKKVPAILIGRLAVDKKFKGQGYGAKTLAEALQKAKSVSREIGIKLIIVDALNEGAKNFYKKFGFDEFDNEPMKLFLEMATVEKIQ